MKKQPRLNKNVNGTNMNIVTSSKSTNDPNSLLFNQSQINPQFNKTVSSGMNQKEQQHSSSSDLKNSLVVVRLNQVDGGNPQQ